MAQYNDNNGYMNYAKQTYAGFSKLLAYGTAATVLILVGMALFLL